MKLSESIAKTVQPLTYRRAWRKVRRLLHPVAPAPLLAGIDQKQLRRLQEELSRPDQETLSLWRHYAKYLDVKTHLRRNIQRAQDLNLHRSSPKRILDLGCGGGFFLYVAQALGHDAIGLDVEGIPVFDRLIQLLGVRRITYRITGQEKLPDLGGDFDLITAFATAFHGGHEDNWRWGAAEWEFLLDDLKDRLKPGGQIFLELNAAYNGEYYSQETLEVFQRHHSYLERGHVLIRKEPQKR